MTKIKLKSIKPFEIFLNFETTGKNKILQVNFSLIFIFNNQQNIYEHYQ